MIKLLDPDNAHLTLIFIANLSTLLISTINVIISHSNAKKSDIIGRNVNGHLDKLQDKLFSALAELDKVKKNDHDTKQS